MTDKARLTLAALVTTFLLVAVSVAGLALHTAHPAPAATAPVSLTTHAAPGPSADWNQEHD